MKKVFITAFITGFIIMAITIIFIRPTSVYDWIDGVEKNQINQNVPDGFLESGQFVMTVKDDTTTLHLLDDEGNIKKSGFVVWEEKQ